MKTVKVLVGVLLMVAVTGICHADATDDLAKENAALKDRVTNLENELSQLKEIVMQQAKDREKTAAAEKPEKPAAATKALIPLRPTDAKNVTPACCLICKPAIKLLQIPGVIDACRGSG